MAILVLDVLSTFSLGAPFPIKSTMFKKIANFLLILRLFFDDIN